MIKYSIWMCQISTLIYRVVEALSSIAFITSHHKLIFWYIFLYKNRYILNKEWVQILKFLLKTPDKVIELPSSLHYLKLSVFFFSFPLISPVFYNESIRVIGLCLIHTQTNPSSLLANKNLKLPIHSNLYTNN